MTMLFELRKSLSCLLLAFVASASGAAHDEHFEIVHDFQKKDAGLRPIAGMAIDAEGHLYGTAQSQLFTLSLRARSRRQRFRRV